MVSHILKVQMADFLKSAASYFSSTNPSNGVGENPLIGTVVNVNSVQLRIKRQIGEGLSWLFHTFSFLFSYESFVLDFSMIWRVK